MHFGYPLTNAPGISHLEIVEIRFRHPDLLHANVEHGKSVHNVEGDGKYHQRRVGSQGDPPEQLLVELLLKALEDQQTDG